MSKQISYIVIFRQYILHTVWSNVAPWNLLWSTLAIFLGSKTCYQHPAMMVSSTDTATIAQFQSIVLSDLPTGLTTGTTLTDVVCSGNCFYQQDMVTDTCKK